MRRWWYFTVERLQITRGERRAIGVLLVLLVVLSAFRWIHAPKPAYDETSYAAFDAALDARVAVWRQQREQKLQRYYPGADSLDKEANEMIAENERKPDTTRARRLNVNRASSEMLEVLPGIGPTLARRIVAWRKAHSGFTSVEQLLEVRGIGDKRLEDIRPLIRVDSTAVRK